MQKPIANFWGSPRSGNAPLNVTFTDIQYRITNCMELEFWRWDIFNPAEVQYIHTLKQGIYTVTLTASSTAGTGTMTKPNYINVTASQKPIADFWGSPKSGNLPLNVVFTDTSKGAPTDWSWNFGVGKYSTVKSPTHTYSAAGNYTVNLTVKYSWKWNPQIPKFH